MTALPRSLGGIYSLNFLDRQLLSILAEPIKRDLMLTDTQLGGVKLQL